VTKWCRRKKIPFSHFRPATRSVLLELVMAAIRYHASVVILVTGDSLATDAEDIKKCAAQVIEHQKPFGVFEVKGGEVRGCTVQNLIYLADYLQACHEHGLAAFFPNDAAPPTPNLSIDTEADRLAAVSMFRRVPLTATVREMINARASEEPVCLPVSSDSMESPVTSDTPSSTATTSTPPSTPSS